MDTFSACKAIPVIAVPQFETVIIFTYVLYYTYTLYLVESF